MTLEERVQIFEFLFEALQSTTSRLEKEHEVKIFEQTYPELKEDWVYILETLDGKHPIGWTFVPRFQLTKTNTANYTYVKVYTIKGLIRMCELTKDKSNATTLAVEYDIGIFGEFLAPIVNRTLRLGIGKSLLEKSDITPMLAKKYEGGLLRGDVVVTEKLDGNRCVASFNPLLDEWEFHSRSGKPMKVYFDMSGLDTSLIYDGEVMSNEQTLLSIKRYDSILNDVDFAHETFDAQLQFNRTSGLINRHDGNKKGLIYNIFDIISPAPYTERREILASLEPVSNEVRILPTLYIGNDVKIINAFLGRMTQMGGEGIMLNRIDRGYEHKRSDALLKYKQVQFMDMRVTGWYMGTGKYAGLVGGLNCELVTADGKNILCDVGSGLSDAQRLEWYCDPSRIIGKIVQIGYHELTQNEENLGSNIYSLRFPRLIKVRTDKIDTSEF
jgi:DNA ligase-1